MHQDAISLCFFANESVVEEIDAGHLFYEEVGRFIYVDGARRVECDPYLSRTAEEMYASSFCVKRPPLARMSAQTDRRLLGSHVVLHRRYIHGTGPRQMR